jgi:hypothetical protein
LGEELASLAIDGDGRDLGTRKVRMVLRNCRGESAWSPDVGRSMRSPTEGPDRDEHSGLFIRPAPPSPSDVFTGYALSSSIIPLRPGLSQSPVKPQRASHQRGPRIVKKARLRPPSLDFDLETSSYYEDSGLDTNLDSNIDHIDCPSVGTDKYELFIEAAIVNAAGFCQIAKNLFVVQGWDSRSSTATVSHFLILSFLALF